MQWMITAYPPKLRDPPWKQYNVQSVFGRNSKWSDTDVWDASTEKHCCIKSLHHSFFKLCWKGLIPYTSSKGSWKLSANCSSLTSHLSSTRRAEIFQKGSQRVTQRNYWNVIFTDDAICWAPLLPDKGNYFFLLFVWHVVANLYLQFSKVYTLWIASTSKMSMWRHSSIKHHRSCVADCLNVLCIP